ncbi:hypothetical protein Anas_11948 [Armadillidium nasatum]|uniref:PRORP domain-containing protein n=1 Tax=Armadillidium nasatum TaxID=96803 RepID=A0A5N5T4P2_9CRUS|nr:hypothetical protein Anas_11948 [Armadillidium nasatum]
MTSNYNSRKRVVALFDEISYKRNVFDTLIIQKCLNLNNIDLAVSYFDCQPLKDVNFSALSFFLLLLGRNINTVRSGLFYEVYEILKGHHPLPDNIIRTLKDETIETALNVISRISNDDERKGHLMKLVKYLHSFEATLNAKNEELLSSVCKNILSIERQKISNGEQCHSCGGSLNLVPLDKEMVTALKIVKFFHFLSEHYGKILIVTRIHTKERFERLKYMSKKFEKIHLFYLDNQDFMRNYNFVMRKHSHLMKTFLYWQSLHQFIIPDGQPYQYHRVPQYNDTTKSWHLPIDSGEEFDYFVPEDEWICLKDLKKDGSIVRRNVDPWDKLLNNVAEKYATKDKYYNFKKLGKPEVHFCDKNKEERNSISVNKYKDDINQ